LAFVAEAAAGAYNTAIEQRRVGRAAVESELAEWLADTSPDVLRSMANALR